MVLTRQIGVPNLKINHSQVHYKEDPVQQTIVDALLTKFINSEKILIQNQLINQSVHKKQNLYT